MKIQIVEGVTYDTEQTSQSEEYYAWLQEHVLSRLGGEDSLSAEKDKYGRPVLFILETEGAVITVRREYIKNGSWAKSGDFIAVEEKGGNA